MTRPTHVGIHEAKTNLSRLVKRAAEGEEIIVENYGKPVARIVAYEARGRERMPGLLAGKITISADFDELPPGFAEAFGE